ncbi:hypothetical protein Ae201684P_022304 [Aphanomyces euteiches]|nr:hypothetical protein Ae201684P_022304 [Aphanomyces euteiches]
MVATYEEIMEAIKRVECGESKAAMKKDKGKIIKKKTGPKQFIPSNIETDFVEWIARGLSLPKFMAFLVQSHEDDLV